MFRVFSFIFTKFLERLIFDIKIKNQEDGSADSCYNSIDVIRLEKELPKRKPIRWDKHDYADSGRYFITVCTEGRKSILSRVLSVGDGAYDVPNIELTETGKIVEKNLLSSNKIKGIIIDQYVIMPNHIHFVVLCEDCGTSRAPSPTNAKIPHLVSTFKRFCHREIGKPIFQRSFYDRVIRDEKEYVKVCSYIYENPFKWREDELYVE